jgi:hypothetical protein
MILLDANMRRPKARPGPNAARILGVSPWGQGFGAAAELLLGLAGAKRTPKSL